jgi:hypothetical protein
MLRLRTGIATGAGRSRKERQVIEKTSKVKDSAQAAAPPVAALRLAVVPGVSDPHGEGRPCHSPCSQSPDPRDRWESWWSRP